MRTTAMRFTIFGCRPKDGLLIEAHSCTFAHAVHMHTSYSVADYKARIYDKEQKGFVKQTSIDAARNTS